MKPDKRPEDSSTPQPPKADPLEDQTITLLGHNAGASDATLPHAGMPPPLMPTALPLGRSVEQLQPGERVFGARFTLEQRVGQGGMGVVWKAHDNELKRTVALKLLPDALRQDERAINALKKETKDSLELTHGSIVRIHDFVTDEEMAGILMEYVDGSSLSKLAAQQPGGVFEVSQLRPWVAQLCEALSYAHEQAGTIHRDLKPSNLMVNSKGALKITDFGIASNLQRAQSGLSLTLATVGSTSGTPRYMSPQQMLGEAPAITDDLYSVGATLYDLLTGQPPFYEGGQDGIALQVQQKVPPSVSERRRFFNVGKEAIPPEWDETLAACLAKDPALRPQSARKLARRLSLDNASNTERTQLPSASPTPTPAPVAAPVPPKAASGGSPLRFLILLLLVPLAIIAALVFWVWHLLTPPKSHEKTSKPAIVASSPQTPIPSAPKPAPQPVSPVVKNTPRPSNTPLPQPTQQASAKPQVAAAKPTPTAPKLVNQAPIKLPDLALTFQWIAAGSFRTTPEDKTLPAPTLVVTQGFWLASTEVTQGQWRMIMGNNPSKNQDDSHPVEQVTWEDAVAFCKRLTEVMQSRIQIPEGYEFALPSEAQWELACRAGDTGETAKQLPSFAWFEANSDSRAHPVASLKSNALGLHDMLGNVWEWCSDYYAELPSGTQVNPSGPSSGSDRVMRGGSWNLDETFSRYSVRNWAAPDFRKHNIGLRPALKPKSIKP